jgi:HD-GYP domain-containing protein (c-di-GMP phosphodiesterase class II)
VSDVRAGGGVRLAELVALLSLGTDLGLGQPMEHVIRESLIALQLADRLGLDEQEREVLYYSGLLAWVGCHTDAYEQAKWFGDDLAVKADAYTFDLDRPLSAAAFMFKYLGGAGRPFAARVRYAVEFAAGGRHAIEQMLTNHYLAADQLAERLGLSDAVRASLVQTYERWDGKNTPLGLRGDQIHLTSRIISLADVVEVFHRHGGVDAAVEVASQRSGSQFDPALVELFCREAQTIFGTLGSTAAWDDVLDAEPLLEELVAETELDGMLEAIGEFGDLKSPWRIGHSSGVARLVTGAAHGVGLSGDDATLLRRAAFVHDIGMLGVSNAVLDKPSTLSESDVERIRLHPYLGERMLTMSSALTPLATIVAEHHERLDGSGYPGRLAGHAISLPGRILAAADTYQSMTQPRPHRAAFTAVAAATELRAEVKAGRLDGDAVDAVLRADGHRVRRGRQWPVGLTTREVEVLRLVACGLSNKEIAHRMSISRKTVGSHVEHVYSKIGCSSRAQASLFAMKHGLAGDT